MRHQEYAPRYDMSTVMSMPENSARPSGTARKLQAATVLFMLGGLVSLYLILGVRSESWLFVVLGTASWALAILSSAKLISKSGAPRSARARTAFIAWSSGLFALWLALAIFLASFHLNIVGI